MVEFIRRNPAETSFRDAVRFAREQRTGDQGEQLRQQRIDQGERAQRLDATLARDLSGAEGTTGTLAREGFGSEALAMTQQQESGKEEDERNAMIALASYGRSGNPAELQNFNMLSQRAGLQVPPELLADSKQAGLFAQASLIAERSYTDPRQAVTFTRTYVQTGGDMEKSANVAGAPRDKPNWTVRNVMRNGQQVVALVDSVSGGVKFPTYQGPGGQPELVQAPAGASGGRPPAKVQMAEWLVRNGVAQDPNKAWEMVNMAVQNPLTARTSVFNSVYNSLTKGFPPTPPEEAQRIANQVADQFVAGMGSPFAPGGGSGAPAPGGGTPAPGGAPAPAVPPAIGAGAAYEADLNGQPIYSSDGQTWYDAQGNPIQ